MDTNSASVLVVDDVAENRDLLVRRLKRLGIADVEQAVTALAAIGRRNFEAGHPASDDMAAALLAVA